MMANAWRDPVWRAAFLLSARETSAYGECDTPEPPDGTAKATHNPFAVQGVCASAFDIGTRGRYTVSRPGSLLDGFCSRCHMPSNYVDNVPLRNVVVDPRPAPEQPRSIRDSIRPPTTEPASRTQPSRVNSQTPTPGSRACSVRSVTHSRRRATRHSATTRAAQDGTFRRQGQGRDRTSSRRRNTTFSTCRIPRNATSDTASAADLSGCRRTPSDSRSGSVLWQRIRHPLRMMPT